MRSKWALALKISKLAFLSCKTNENLKQKEELKISVRYPRSLLLNANAIIVDGIAALGHRGKIGELWKLWKHLNWFHFCYLRWADCDLNRNEWRLPLLTQQRLPLASASASWEPGKADCNEVQAAAVEALGRWRVGGGGRRCLFVIMLRPLVSSACCAFVGALGGRIFVILQELGSEY